MLSLIFGAAKWLMWAITVFPVKSALIGAATWLVKMAPVLIL